MLKKYRKKVEDKFSNIEYADISWLNLLVGGNIFFTLGAVINIIYPSYPNDVVEVIALFIFMNITGIKGVLQAGNFIKQSVDIVSEEEVELHQALASNAQLLQDQDSIILSQKLKKYMLDEKPYLNPTLSLKDLAAAMDTYPHYITRILHSTFNQNFYDFVNHYRVQEAERQLAEPSKNNLTILAVAYDSGFNSKATFNRVFKEKKGITPTEFKSSVLQ